MKKCLIVLALFPFLTNGFLLAREESRLLRFPAIHEYQIVFTYAGDLYTVPSIGGVARRLTNHEGFEMFARFSPDGKTLAFTGQYDGNTEVYIMPAEGGIPKRLTYTPALERDDVWDRMGPNNIVMGWKHDNKHILFRSRMRSFNSFVGSLYLVSTGGGLSEEIPLPRGGFCSYSPEDTKLAYNRIFREFRTWKRYRGGMADDIWIYDFGKKTTTNVTNNPAQDIIPMWRGDKIFFLSDRDPNKRMNLYVYDLASGETRGLTQFKEFDIKFPSLGKDAIVFENGGYIHRFDLSSEKHYKVPIYILEDSSLGRGGIMKANKNIVTWGISPDGQRALFGARGEIFAVPAKYGNTQNLTSSSGIHERNPVWSPDGKWIAWVSDKSGEDEIYIIPQGGGSSVRQVTFGQETYKYEIRWSPDSRKILWSDKKLRLRFVEVESKVIREVAQAEAWEIRSFNWSPDSQWIAYAKTEEEGMPKLYLYSLETGRTHEVTEGWYSAAQPVFSTDGKYLFFISDRNFNPTFGRTEWNHVFLDMSGIYLVTLSKDLESPFKPKSDEVQIEKEESKEKEEKDKAGGKEKKEEKVAVTVDAEGLKDRVLALPVPASSYWNLASVDDKVFYIRRGTQDKDSLFEMYDLTERKETHLGEIDGFEISANGKKMIVSKGGNYAIIDLPKASIQIKENLDLSGMEMDLNRREEWLQIFNECWRQMREFFYAPNMHGVNWEKIRETYLPLVSHVNHRADLTYVIGEMVGELNAGHCYVGGGDMPRPERIQTGMLGARLVRHEESRSFRIEKILKGQNWNPSLRSPLTEIGVLAKEGEYILAVQGVPTDDMADIYAALVNTAGKQVRLKINSEPSEEGSREVVVVPIAGESELYYYNWVEGNLRKVEEATHGKVGYIHIPDMSTKGLNEFVKYFYPQLRKKALIIDVRGNGGGSVSPQIIERLAREIAMVDMARNTTPKPDPSAMVYGPKVCLLDEFSASDGDLFPYRFKKYKMGKLIGKRSWGGVVGIRGSLPLLDGGYLMKPEFASYDDEGKGWIIEGIGVEPDIVVDNDPAKEYSGIDEQLNKAVEVILEELKKYEKTLPPIPPYPDKK